MNEWAQTTRHGERAQGVFEELGHGPPFVHHRLGDSVAHNPHGSTTVVLIVCPPRPTVLSTQQVFVDLFLKRNQQSLSASIYYCGS